MISVKIVLYNYNKPTKKGYPVKIRITDGKSKKSKYINTKVYAFADQWNDDEMVPLPNHPNYNKALTIILNYKIKINNALADEKYEFFSISNMDTYLQGSLTNHKSFFEYANYVNDELENTGRYHTAEKNKYAVKSLQLFVGKGLTFDNFNKELIRNYIKWATNVRGMSQNGIRSYLASLKSIYNSKMDSTTPFKGIMPTVAKTRSKAISIPLMRVFYQAANQNINNSTPTKISIEACIDYFVATFLLGGIDIVDLRNLTQQNISNGRLIMQRSKGGTNEWINNMISPLAINIIKKYSSNDRQYLFPIAETTNYKTFYSNYVRNIRLFQKSKGFNEYLSSKSARYSFINYAKNAGVPRAITEEIVGHSRKDIHSIYESGYPDHVKDRYHLEIIGLV